MPVGDHREPDLGGSYLVPLLRLRLVGGEHRATAELGVGWIAVPPPRRPPPPIAKSGPARAAEPIGPNIGGRRAILATRGDNQAWYNPLRRRLLPTPTKFTRDRQRRIIELLAAGASRRTAAQVAGIDHQTLLNWLRRGESAKPDTMYHRFREDVLKAEASPRLRALGTVYNAIPDDPGLAFRFLERREPGFAPGTHVPDGGPAHPDPSAPAVIQLTFAKPPFDRFDIDDT